MTVIDWSDRIASARRVVRSVLEPTPLVATSLDGFDAPAFLKLESLLPTGSFKVRGALAAVDACAADGVMVVTASAGNHGLGIAFAARRLGVAATVIVPSTASPAKIAALEKFDVELQLVGTSYEEAEAAAVDMARHTGARFVSAYSDPDVIAGRQPLSVRWPSGFPASSGWSFR